MAPFVRRMRTRVITPTAQTIALGIRLNYLIWTKYFDSAWEATPLHEKLTWILFVTHSLAILTLIQILAFK